MGVAAAAAALFQIVFEGVVVLRNALDRADSSIAEFGTTEVGVQHDAGGIDDRAQAHGCFFGDTADDLIADAVDLHRRFLTSQNLLAQRVDDFADRFGQNGVLTGQGSKLFVAQQLIHLWNLS